MKVSELKGAELDHLRSLCVIRDNGCWGYLLDTSARYPRIMIGGRRWRLNRLVYALAVGPIPKGKCVCHRCDNPRCINPEHLFAASHADNMYDMKAKGRAMGKEQKGSRNTSAVLLEYEIPEIRKLLEDGVPQYVIAAGYGVCQSQISAIKRGKAWTHVT